MPSTRACAGGVSVSPGRGKLAARAPKSASRRGVERAPLRRHRRAVKRKFQFAGEVEMAGDELAARALAQIPAARRGSGPVRSGSGRGTDSRRAAPAGSAVRPAAAARRAPCAGCGSGTGAAATQRLGVGMRAAGANTSSARPLSTMRPRYITTTRRETCAHDRQVVGDEQIGDAVARSAGPAAGSPPAPAPRRRAPTPARRRSARFGSSASARAMPMRWRWPPENSCG